jgi:hypothetical protein
LTPDMVKSLQRQGQEQEYVQDIVNGDLSWFLTAFIKYPFELGLRATPWLPLEERFGGGRKREAVDG